MRTRNYASLPINPDEGFPQAFRLVFLNSTYQLLLYINLSEETLHPQLSYTGDTATGTNRLWNMNTTAEIQIGMLITGPGVPAHTIVTTLDAFSVTMSNNAVLANTQAAYQFSRLPNSILDLTGPLTTPRRADELPPAVERLMAFMVLRVLREDPTGLIPLLQHRIVPKLEIPAGELVFLFDQIQVDPRNLNGTGSFGSVVSGKVAARWGS
jgi:hypothetical protein